MKKVILNLFYVFCLVGGSFTVTLAANEPASEVTNSTSADTINANPNPPVNDTITINSPAVPNNTTTSSTTAKSEIIQPVPVNPSTPSTTINNATSPAQNNTPQNMQKSAATPTTTPKHIAVKKSHVLPNNNTMHVTLKLLRKNDRLFAMMLITQQQNKAGSIRVVWLPPLHSDCRNSEYPLHYQNRRFHTYAYRSVRTGNHLCAGTWQIHVINSQDQVVNQAAFSIHN